MGKAPDASDLLKHFDDELAQRLKKHLAAGELDRGHIEGLLKLTSKSPEYRQEENLESAIEDALDMPAEAFGKWVEELLDTSK